MGKILGIVGGMGPWASAYFLRKIIDMTDAQSDQEHIRIILDNNTQITDRTSAILKKGPSPVPQINSSIHMLEQYGAEIIAMPCNTAHYFMDQFICHSETRILSIITAVLSECARKEISSLFGILATEGTIQAKIYQDALSRHGMRCIIPQTAEQDIINHMIFNVVKKGEPSDRLLPLAQVLDSMSSRGVTHFVLGCTELSMLCEVPEFHHYHIIDSTTALAAYAIVECGYHVRGDSYR